MNKAESFILPPEGVVTIDQVKDGVIIHRDTVHNLIVNNAHLIVRDLLYNASFQNTLNTLGIGDMNLKYTDDYSNLEPPLVTDTTLVNKIFSVSSQKTSRYMSGSRYCIKNEFGVGKSDANDDDLSIYYKLITEFGLFTRGLTMFSRLVKPIVKTRDIALSITWTIYL